MTKLALENFRHKMVRIKDVFGKEYEGFIKDVWDTKIRILVFENDKQVGTTYIPFSEIVWVKEVSEKELLKRLIRKKIKLIEKDKPEFKVGYLINVYDDKDKIEIITDRTEFIDINKIVYFKECENED